MSYIVIVNPAILASPGSGMPFSGVLTATVMVAFLSTLLMGLYARLPFALAPGMGLNAFFTFTLILGRNIPWPIALGMVFWSGVLFLIASATPLREAVVRAIPKNLRIAAAAGIGLFLTFIGLKNAGFIVADPVTFVRAGNFSRDQAVAIVGLLVAAWLLRRRSPFAFLGGIASATGVCAVLGGVTLPPHIVQAPDFTSVLFKLDIWGALRLAWLPAMVTLLFTDLFDSLSTFVGISQASGLTDTKGEPKNLRRALIVDACSTLFSGLLGSSPGTAYVESSAGIEAGGRTGRTAVVCALCFLPCLFLAPLAGMVPAAASAPVLILVGTFMFRQVSGLKLEHLEDLVPAFLTMVLMPLTFSITQGILWGFLAHTGLYLLAGRRKELPGSMVGLAVLAAVLLALDAGWLQGTFNA
jgi:AGZA family xanthine/uracil permease-like MFS transporter